MNIETGGNRRWLLGVLMALACAAIGAGGMYLYTRRLLPPMERTHEAIPASSPVSAANRPQRDDGPLADVTITLTPEAVQRAGIKVAAVRSGAEAGVLRLPGVVEPNAYRQVMVTPLVAGRITNVSAALGDHVTRGQALAQVYSPELAEAQTRYLSMSVALEAAHQKLIRTERLVAIGSASTQELESIRAEHTAHSTELEGARAKLMLLGLSADRIAQLRTAADVTATVAVPAPQSGTIIERSANVGLNVDPSMALFKVADLSTVWVIGDLYERDFISVTIGSQVTVTTTAYPGMAVQGKVSYIDPQVNPTSRTAKVRIEVTNRGQPLRPGMFADISVSGAATAGALVVSRSAVQAVGDRHVVYLSDPKQPGKFVEREVRLGEATAKDVQVISGVAAGDAVATEGSFSLRAEGERQGLRSGNMTNEREVVGAR